MSNNKDDDNLSAALLMVFLCGVLVTIFLTTLFTNKISTEELYRFCLMKEISLEDCKIPVKPFKGEEVGEKHE